MRAGTWAWGIAGVALPEGFVIQSSQTSRTTNGQHDCPSSTDGIVSFITSISLRHIATFRWHWLRLLIERILCLDRTSYFVRRLYWLPVEPGRRRMPRHPDGNV